MRRSLTLLAAAAALAAAGCGAPAAKKAAPLSAADAAVVKGHAAADGRAAPVPTGNTQLENEAKPHEEAEVRRGKILGPDPDGCTWVEGEASIAVGEKDTRHQAHAAAVERAEDSAVRDFLGVDIKSRSMDFQQEGLRHEARLTESLLQTTRSGRVIKEDVLEEGYRDIPKTAGNAACPSCLYYAHLKACVVPNDAGADKDFRVELQLSQTRFFAGDKATFVVTATRDCWVYLYDVYDLGADNKTAMVIPDEFTREKRLKAGEAWLYPDDAALKRGVKIEAQLPDPKDDMSAEVIRVVASKTPLTLAVYDPTVGGYLGVMRRLVKSRAEWAEDSEAYTIYKK